MSAEPAAGSAWSSWLAKAALVVLLGGGSGYAVHAFESRGGASVASAPVASGAGEPTTSAGARQALPAAAAPSVVAAAAPQTEPLLQLPTAAPDLAPRLQLDPRLAEAELLEKARALVSSKPEAALAVTVDYARQYPNGHMGAEADLIAAQSLLHLGDKAGAAARAKASLARYPHGPYVEQLREIVAAR